MMGVFFGIAAKNDDIEKARKMIKNYVIGLVVIAVILVACPYLVRGIAAVIAGLNGKKSPEKVFMAILFGDFLKFMEKYSGNT